ncbi:MAG: hypothetical protein KC613_10880 [Myxococcales bacterium]|nr:hypothetical protein [Myxococcales bacterium]
MLPLLFLVNDIDELKPAMTTALLMHEAAGRPVGAAVAMVDGLDVTDERIQVRARALVKGATVADTLAQVRAATPTVVALSDYTVALRTNPARDLRGWAHEHLLDVLRIAALRGVRVVNDPDALSVATSKLFLSSFPVSVRPETLVSSDPAALRAFVAAQPGPTVLKPLHGTRGRDVFRVSGDGADQNLNAIIDVLTRQGVAMAQAWLPEGPQGDTRVVLLDGEILMAGGKPCAVQRRPPSGDFRSNVAVGGRAEAANLTDAQRTSCAIIGERLRMLGLRLVGVDLVGHKAVELNVFSTGGLEDAGRFAGVDFIPPVIDALLSPAGGTPAAAPRDPRSP